MLDVLRSSSKASLLAPAFDALHTNVMIADENLNIVHMNPALFEFMRQAEDELKREMPQFSVARLIGSNIDIFHKAPAHQRNLLARLEKTHEATIRIGKQAFDLTVTPLRRGKKRVGFVVEWANANVRLQNIDYAAQIAALGSSQAVIEFLPDGKITNANRRFCEIMGYVAEEILGKHHSMFAEPSLRDSQDYRDFWARLRRGEFQVSQYKRIGKNGKEIWLQGSYNPIVIGGEVVKVVKFATDVTETVYSVQRIGAALSTLAAGNL